VSRYGSLMTTTKTRTAYRTITVSAAARQGLIPRKITAEALHAWLPADGSACAMWDRIGNVHGEVIYGISHFRRYSCETTGTSGAEIVREDGTPVVRHPMGQGRHIRILAHA